MQQLTLFDLMQQESDFPCYNCVFDRHGCCNHVEDAECYCVRGSFQIKPSQIICPQCGREMQVVQNNFGRDGAVCSCGTVKVFDNQGNRPTAFELWKRGLLVGV